MSPPEISCFAGPRAITFLCFASGAIGFGGAAHPLTGVGFGARDLGGAVEVEPEEQVVRGDGCDVVVGLEGHAVRDRHEVPGDALLLADVALGDLVHLGGGREDEAEQDELVRFGGRPSADVDGGLLCDLLVEVGGEGSLDVEGEVLVLLVVGGDDVAALDGVGLDVRPRVPSDDVLDSDVERVGAEAEVGRGEGLSGLVLVLYDGASELGVVVVVELGGVNNHLIESGGGRVGLFFWSLVFAV